MTSWHFGDRERACVVTKACCICTSSWWLHVALALWAKAWMWLAVERASHLAAWYSLGLSATDSCSHYYKCTQLTHIMQREGKKSGGRRSGEGNGDHLIISCFYQGTGFTTELRLIIRQYLWLVWVLWKSLKHCAFNMKTKPYHEPCKGEECEYSLPKRFFSYSIWIFICNSDHSLSSQNVKH